MSAERGWIGEAQPPQEWHTPGWLSEKGTGHSHFHPDKYVATEEHEHWQEKDGVSIRGHSDPHLHSPCPQCGYATRYKQFGPIRCACPGQSLWDKRLAEIHAIEPTRYVRGSDGKLTCAIHKKEHDDT